MSLFTASFAFVSDFLGTDCWIDHEGDVLELAVTSVGDGTSFNLNGIHYDDELASPTTGRQLATWPMSVAPYSLALSQLQIVPASSCSRFGA